MCGSSTGSGSGGPSGYSLASELGVSKEAYNSGTKGKVYKEVKSNLKSGKVSGDQLKSIKGKAESRINELKSTRREIWNKTNGKPYGTEHYNTYKSAANEINSLRGITELYWKGK